MRYLIIFLFLLVQHILTAQNSDTTRLSLLFMGDIMGHDSQINSALQEDGNYDYTDVFQYVKDEIGQADLAIANLEVTLAGPPYQGYPQFSSPDALAVAAINAGVDVFGTANNHSVDRGKNGIIRTINTLDSLAIPHTGTFKDSVDQADHSPLLIEKNGFKLAFINFTYGTNGLAVPLPTIVNLITYDNLASQIEKAKSASPDKIILFIHWGIEYQTEPNQNQLDIANFCISKGVDIIIGSHPHVIQKSEWVSDSTSQSEHFTTYSLGNFLSNQRKPKTDGGQMIKLVLEKVNNQVFIKESGYYLTWVYTPIIESKKHFYILPCAQFELQPEFFATPNEFDKMKEFIADSRNLLNSQNKGVREYIFFNNQWGF